MPTYSHILMAGVSLELVQRAVLKTDDMSEAVIESGQCAIHGYTQSIWSGRDCNMSQQLSRVNIVALEGQYGVCCCLLGSHGE